MATVTVKASTTLFATIVVFEALYATVMELFMEVAIFIKVVH